jgi:hypothetical protein
MPFVFRRTPSVNHLRLRLRLRRLHLRRRRHLRYRFRRHHHQPDCPNYPMRNGRRRSRGSRRGRRHSRRRPLRNCRSTIAEVGGGSVIASSLRSRSATCRRPRSRVPSSRSSSFPLAPNACRSPLAHRKSYAAAHICRQMWRSRSLIIQVKCGTFTLTDRFVAVLAR